MSTTGTTQCAEVRQWLSRPFISGDLDPTLLVHIASCAACRGALKLLMAEMTGVPALQLEIDHDSCQEGLAAYIDLEDRTGAEAATRTHPQIAWHLLTCEMCAETYQLTRALLEAERSGTVAPPPPLTSANTARRSLFATMRLARSFLHQALPIPSPLLGMGRGDEDSEAVLFETGVNGYRISLSVARQADTRWSIIVTVHPQIDGWLALSLDGQTQYVPLSSGTAIVRDIPTSSLAAPVGPDLIGQIELEAPPQDFSG